MVVLRTPRLYWDCFQLQSLKVAFDIRFFVLKIENLYLWRISWHGILAKIMTFFPEKWFRVFIKPFDVKKFLRFWTCIFHGRNAWLMRESHAWETRNESWMQRISVRMKCIVYKMLFKFKVTVKRLKSITIVQYISMVPKNWNKCINMTVFVVCKL